MIVKRLSDLDVPLRDIAEILHAYAPDVTRKVIGQHEHDMREKSADVTRIVNELQQSLDQKSLHTLVHIRHEDEVHALSFSGGVQNAEYATFLDGAYPALFAVIEATSAQPVEKWFCPIPGHGRHRRRTHPGLRTDRRAGATLWSPVGQGI